MKKRGGGGRNNVSDYTVEIRVLRCNLHILHILFQRSPDLLSFRRVNRPRSKEALSRRLISITITITTQGRTEVDVPLVVSRSFIVHREPTMPTQFLNFIASVGTGRRHTSHQSLNGLIAVREDLLRIDQGVHVMRQSQHEQRLRRASLHLPVEHERSVIAYWRT